MKNLIVFSLTTSLSGVGLFVLLKAFNSKYVSSYSIGLWKYADRPSWLPYKPNFSGLIGNHYFGDFFQLYYLAKSHLSYTGSFYHTVLNPGYLFPAYLVSWIPYPLAGFIYLFMLVGIFLIPIFFVMKRSIKNALFLFAVIAFTIPVICCFDLGQPEVILFILTFYSLYYFESNKTKSAIFLGFAIALKPYIALFLLMFLVRKKFKHSSLAIGIALIANFIMGILLAGKLTLNLKFWRTIINGLLSYGNGESIWNQAIFLWNNSSLFSFTHTLRMSSLGGISVKLNSILDSFDQNIKIFIYILLITSLVGFVSLWRKWDYISEWIFISCVLLLLPSYMLGYAWVLLLSPIILMFHNEGKNDNRALHAYSESWLPYLSIIAVSIYPVNIIVTGYPDFYSPTSNSVTTPIVLLFIIGLIVFQKTTNVVGNSGMILKFKNGSLLETAIVLQAVTACVSYLLSN